MARKIEKRMALKDALPLPQAVYDGYFKGQDGVWVAFFSVPTGVAGFGLAADEFTERVFRPVTQVFNDLAPGEHCQLVTTVVPRSFSKHLEAVDAKIDRALPDEYQVYPGLYKTWLGEFGRLNRLPDFRFYVLFRTAQASGADDRAVDKLMTRAEAFKDRFRGATGLSLEKMDRDQIVKVLDTELNPGFVSGGPGAKSGRLFDMDRKASISTAARMDIEEGPGVLLHGDKLTRTVFLQEAPDLGARPFMLRLFNLSQPFRFSLHAWGMGQSDLVEAVKKNEREGNNTYNAAVSEGKTVPAEAKIAIQEAADLLVAHARGDIRFFQAAATITFYGENPEHLARVQEEVLGCFSENCRVNLGNLAQFELFRISLPLCFWEESHPILDPLRGVRWEALTSEAARLFPFYSCRLGTGGEDAGVFVGLSASREPVHHFLYTDKLSNSIVVAMGAPGKGKSFLLNKFLLSLNAYNSFRVVIDRSESYNSQLDLYKGQKVKVTLNAPFSLNVFDLAPEDLDPRDDSAVAGALKVSLVATFLSIIAKKEEDAEFYGLIERLVYDSYKEMSVQGLEFGVLDGLRVVKTAKLDRVPTLDTFRKALEAAIAGADKFYAPNKARLQDLNTALGPYFDGSMARLFNGKTNISLEKDFILFDTSGLPAEAEKPVNILITGFIKQKFSQNKYKYAHQVLIIDELWHLASNSVGAKFLVDFSRLARHYRAAVYGLTQLISDFLKNEGASSLLRTAQVQYIHGVNPADLDTIGKTFDLNAVERSQIAGLEWKKGRYSDVFAIYGDQNRGVIRVYSDTVSYWIATTDKNDRPIKQKVNSKWTFQDLNSDGSPKIINGEPVYITDHWAALRELSENYLAG